MFDIPMEDAELQGEGFQVGEGGQNQLIDFDSEPNYHFINRNHISEYQFENSNGSRDRESQDASREQQARRARRKNTDHYSPSQDIRPYRNNHYGSQRLLDQWRPEDNCHPTPTSDFEQSSTSQRSSQSAYPRRASNRSRRHSPAYEAYQNSRNRNIVGAMTDMDVGRNGDLHTNDDREDRRGGGRFNRGHDNRKRRRDGKPNLEQPLLLHLAKQAF